MAFMVSGSELGFLSCGTQGDSALEKPHAPHWAVQMSHWLPQSQTPCKMCTSASPCQLLLTMQYF